MMFVRFLLPNIMKTIVAVVLIFCASFACAQAQTENKGNESQPTRPEDKGREIQIWTGGGYTVPGGTSQTGVWDLGARYGWILTAPHGPSFLKGRFEYAVDAVPMFLVFQPANTAYGAGVNPLNLKWNFATRGKLAPFFELSGGTLFTNHNVPANTSSVNFTTSAALGTYLLRESHAWSLEVRYMHISNSGLANLNPGINTVQFRLGIGKFLGKH